MDAFGYRAPATMISTKMALLLPQWTSATSDVDTGHSETAVTDIR